METIGWILGTLLSVVWTLLGIVWWIVSTLLWTLVWLLLPVAIVAFIALRIAESVLGEKVVRDWVKARALRYGAGTWDRVRPLLFALGVAPFRVLVWFVIYAVWHAVVSIFWKPRWQPWTRAWGRRWKAERAKTTTAVSKGSGGKS
jgi:hypothetical protein